MLAGLGARAHRIFCILSRLSAVPLQLVFARVATALFQPFPMLAGHRAQAWQHQPEYRRPRHFHAEAELNLIVRGRGVVGLGARAVHVGRGDLLLFHPGQDHVLLEASPDFDLWVLALRPELAARARISRAVGSAHQCTLDPRELDATAAEFAALRELRDAETHELRLAAFFERSVPRFVSHHALSRRALDQMRADATLSGAALAKRLKTGPSSVSRRFHLDLSVPLAEYRARIRLIEFVQAVDAGNRYIRAALQAGFGSYAQCHRVFRRTLGCAPSAYFAGQRHTLGEATYANLTILASG